MPRPRTKDDLLIASKENFEALNNLIDNFTDVELNTPFDFSDDEKKKEAHWSRDKNIRDVLVHLYEWHNLLISFVEDNLNGNAKPFLPSPYTWKNYGQMNVGFWNKHQNTSMEDAKKMLNDTHNKIMKLAQKFSNEELFSKNVYRWVGGTSLGSYFVSATSSHYDWAIKKLKAHKKKLKNK